MWRGDTIRCNGTDEIVFRHAQFLRNGNRTKVCNAGAVSGQSLNVVEDKYTSRLNIALTSELIGKNVICSHDTLDLEELISEVFTGIVMMSLHRHYHTVNTLVNFHCNSATYTSNLNRTMCRHKCSYLKWPQPLTL